MGQSEHYSEIEVKLWVEDLETVRKRLEASKATLVTARTHEQNLRYDNADGNFADKGLVLRLRQDEKVRITYKEPSNPTARERGVHDRFEVEIIVSDFDAANVIIQKLGYEVVMTYEKYRTTYNMGGAEVVLDEMPYGTFVEVEAGNEGAIDMVLDHLGLSDAPRIPYSYAQLFQQVKANLNMDTHDLTFAAFEGVNVPVEAFAFSQMDGDSA